MKSATAWRIWRGYGGTSGFIVIYSTSSFDVCNYKIELISIFRKCIWNYIFIYLFINIKTVPYYLCPSCMVTTNHSHTSSKSVLKAFS